jgi:hypothetical protein
LIRLTRSSLFLSCLSLLLFLTVACGAGGLEGTYYSTSAGNDDLELRYLGTANFTIMGETQACTWNADDSKVAPHLRGRFRKLCQARRRFPFRARVRRPDEKVQIAVAGGSRILASALNPLQAYNRPRIVQTKPSLNL